MEPSKKQFLKTVQNVKNHINVHGDVREIFGRDLRAIRNNKSAAAAVRLSDIKDVRNLKPSDDNAVSGDALASLKAGQEPAIDTGTLGRKRK
jgi:hypothetical protein